MGLGEREGGGGGGRRRRGEGGRAGMPACLLANSLFVLL